jgi:hypothetical protein
MKETLLLTERAFRRHLLDADNFIAQLLEGHSNVFDRGVTGQMP